MKRVLIVISLISAGLLGGCATPLGQQYGTIGAIGGAAAGAAIDGGRGAVVGGVLGALGGGALGDHQQFENDRNRGYSPRYEPPYYEPRYEPCCERPYRYEQRYYYEEHRRPCYWVQVPIFNRFGQTIGQRVVCR